MNNARLSCFSGRSQKTRRHTDVVFHGQNDSEIAASIGKEKALSSGSPTPITQFMHSNDKRNIAAHPKTMFLFFPHTTGVVFLGKAIVCGCCRFSSSFSSRQHQLSLHTHSSKIWIAAHLFWKRHMRIRFRVSDTDLSVSLRILRGGDCLPYLRINFGDGTWYESSVRIPHFAQRIVHEFHSPGEYVVGIFGSCFTLLPFVAEDAPKVVNVVSWGGGIALGEGAFSGCANMEPREDDDVFGTPKFADNKCDSLFANSSFNQNIGEWDVSKVTSMSKMFANTSTFNQPIGAWDVSNVENMESMFAGCKAFNMPLFGWRVPRCRNFSGMFDDCESFRQPTHHLLGQICGEGGKDVCRRCDALRGMGRCSRCDEYLRECTRFCSSTEKSSSPSSPFSSPSAPVSPSSPSSCSFSSE